MYERALDKSLMPDEAAIQNLLGRRSWERLNDFEKRLHTRYHLTRELKFPFGNNYGWGYKYGHRASCLCYAFFESGAFTVMLQIGDKLVPLMESLLPVLLPQTKSAWENRYPCGGRGGWLHYRVLNDDELADIVQILEVKKKPSVT